MSITKFKTHITQVHPPARAPTPSTALIARAPGPRAPRAQPKPAGTCKRQRRGLEVVVVLRVRGEHFVEEGQEATVFGEGARRGRDRRGAADGEVGVGRRGVKVGEKVRGGIERVGEDFLVCCVAVVSFPGCELLGMALLLLCAVLLPEQ